MWCDLSSSVCVFGFYTFGLFQQKVQETFPNLPSEYTKFSFRCVHYYQRTNCVQFVHQFTHLILIYVFNKRIVANASDILIPINAMCPVYGTMDMTSAYPFRTL